MRHPPPAVVEALELSGPAPMEGAGAYNRNSRVQAGGLRPAIPLLEEAARNVPLAPGNEPVVIADYGAASGHNSMAPIAAAIAALRQRTASDRAISVVHTDVPGNDFAGLFQTIENDPDSYRRGASAVFSSAVGRSFYEQILPDNSVTLGWSSWAVQWLSRTPGPIPDQIQIACSDDSAPRAAYAQQAAEDWRQFLTHRGRELRPGGRLVLITMALRDDGAFGYELLLPALYELLLDLTGEGFLKDGEVERMVIPTVGRRRADFLAPFGSSGEFGSLLAQMVDVFAGEDGIWAAYERDHDAVAFGARWAAFSRASVFQTLALGLDEGLGDPRAAAFIAALEGRLAAKLARRPARMSLPLARLVLVKKDGRTSRYN
jgi:hypothetical protein